MSIRKSIEAIILGAGLTFAGLKGYEFWNRPRVIHPYWNSPQMEVIVLKNEQFSSPDYHAFAGPACLSSKRLIPQPRENISYLKSIDIIVPTNYTILVKKGYSIEKCPDGYATPERLEMRSKLDGGPREVCPYDPSHKVHTLNTHAVETHTVEERSCFDKDNHEISHPPRTIKY